MIQISGLTEHNIKVGTHVVFYLDWPQCVISRGNWNLRIMTVRSGYRLAITAKDRAVSATCGVGGTCNDGAASGLGNIAVASEYSAKLPLRCIANSATNN